MLPLQLTPSWRLPVTELQARFVRSGGPGGQNVNKVSTKVELRFLLRESRVLTEPQKARLTARYPSHVTQAGEFVVTCDESRSQAMNLESARKRLRAAILEIRTPPRARRATRPSLGAKKRRLSDKRRRSEIKKQRGRLSE